MTGILIFQFQRPPLIIVTRISSICNGVLLNYKIHCSWLKTVLFLGKHYP